MNNPLDPPVQDSVAYSRHGFNIRFVVSLMALAGLSFAEAPVLEVIHRRHFAMGTWLDLRIEAGTRSQALAASEAAIEAVDDAENRLSTWREDSELSKLNHSLIGEWIELSSLLTRDLEAASRWERLSDGAFQPGVGLLVERWDLRGEGRVPSNDELDSAVLASAPDGAEFDGRKFRRLRVDYRFEEGGFGKGAALVDAIAAARAANAHSVTLDFGGQVVTWGAPGLLWVSVASPIDRQSEIARLRLTGGSAATSGVSERGITVGGERLGHILDPRTGMPVADWGSVTVIASDPLTADCVSTALYVMGPLEGAGWLTRHPDIEAVFVVRNEEDFELFATSKLEGRLEPTGGRSIQWLASIKPAAIESSKTVERLN